MSQMKLAKAHENIVHGEKRIPNATFRLIPLIDTFESVTKSDPSAYESDRPHISRYLTNFSSRFDARADYEAVLKFLRSHEDTKTTFNNYRTQVERLMLWAWNKQGKAVLDFLRSDVEEFLSFCKSPDPTWVSTSIKNRYALADGVYQPNPEWRPFVMRTDKAIAKSAAEDNRDIPAPTFSMAPSSLKQVYGILNSFFSYCASDRLIGANPCALIKKSKKKIKSKELVIPQVKALSQLQWEFLLETAELMADEKPVPGERALFCIVMMFGCYLRVSDLAGNGVWVPTMGSFERTRDAWWYHVVGKGDVQDKIAVKPDCIEYLKRYRRSRGLSAYPSLREATPLLVTVHGRPGLKARQIRDDVQAVLDRTVQRMKEADFPDHDVSELRSATLHWLRHTGATFDAPYRNPKHLQKDMRHKSLATTQNIYYHALDDERSHEVAKLTLRR